MFSQNTLLKIAFNTILGLVLILIWLQFVDLRVLWQSLSEVSPAAILPVAFLIITSLGIRALRLKYFLRPIKQIPFKELFFLNGAALLFNILIPIRAGEVLKGIYLNTNFTLPFTKSITWIFLDRFLDFLFVLVAGAILLLVIPTTLSITVIKVIIVIFAVGLFLAYLMVYQPQLSRKLFNFTKPLLVFDVIKFRMESIFNYFLESFVVLKRSFKDFGLVFLLTLLAYLSDSLAWYFGFLALGSSQDLMQMFLAQLLSALTYLVPAAPGYVGSAEASGILVFSGILGIEVNLASSTTVLNHIITIITALIFGVISINFLKINIKAIFRKLSNRA